MSEKTRKDEVVDRREHPREFFIAGWDPYIVSLTEQDSEDEQHEETAPQAEATTESVAKSRRAALLAGTED